MSVPTSPPRRPHTAAEVAILCVCLYLGLMSLIIAFITFLIGVAQGWAPGSPLFFLLFLGLGLFVTFGCLRELGG